MTVVHIYLDGHETADYTDVMERWELTLGNVCYSLMSHVPLTRDDARLHMINTFSKMQCKNGYGFNSITPTKVWEDAF